MPQINATAQLIRSCEAAEARLEPLLTVIQPLGRTKPDALVSADLITLARQALRAITPVAMHLEAPAPLPLHPPVTFAGLAARLALAAQQAATFRRRHVLPQTPLEAITWHIEDHALAIAAGRPSGE